jgi:type VI secretion system secreted protein Hcp
MAFDAYLFIKTVEGESAATIEKPTGMDKPPMDVISFSFGASNPTNLAAGGSGAGKVSVSSLNIMKKTDNASPVLFQQCCQGKHFEGAALVLRKSGGNDNPDVFLTYELKQVYIESIQWSGSSGGDDVPTESLSLAFAEINITNFVQDKDGKMKKGNGAGYNVKTVAKLK